MVVSCCLETGVMECWSTGVLGQAWNTFDFFLPTFHPSNTPLKKKHSRQIKPDGISPDLCCYRLFYPVDFLWRGSDNSSTFNSSGKAFIFQPGPYFANRSLEWTP